MIKLGMIGGGLNSAVGAAHVAALRLTGRFELVAGCFSTDQGKQGVNYRSAQAYGPRVRHAVSDASLIAYEGIDRVVVLSPTPLHLPHVLACQRARIPVLCEKALGVFAAETAEICKHLDSPVACVFNYAFYPAVQELRQLIVDQKLGQLTHVHVEMPQSGYLNSHPQLWRRSDRGVYLDLGTHLHHLLWFLTSYHPDAVESCVERSWSDVGVVDYVSTQLRYDHFQAHAWFSKVSAGYTNGLRIRVFGTEGSAEWYQREPDTLRLANRELFGAVVAIEVANPRFKLGHPTGFVEALANLYDVWADDPRHPDLSPAVAHQGLVLVEAMRRSAAEGRVVML